MLIYRLIFFVLVGVLLVGFVSASYNFDAFVNNNIESFEMDAEYGSSPQITVKVINNNQDDWGGWFDSSCNLYCSYFVNGNFIENFDTLDGNGDDDTDSFGLVLKDKGKENAKDSFVFDFKCDISTAGTCDGGNLEKSITLTVNYLLNPQQKAAKAFIEEVLIIVNENIKNTDAKIKQVEAKINGLTENVKINSIPSELDSIKNNHNSLKSEVENIDKIVKQDFDYILAKNTYRTSLPVKITTNGDNAKSLEIRLDQIIALHNEVSAKIDDLGKRNAEINSKISIIGEENPLDDDINTIINNFQSGNFQTYEGLQSKIVSLDSQLSALDKEINDKISKAGLSTSSVLDNEIERLCKKYGFCLKYEEIDNVEESCNPLNKLQNDIIDENKKRTMINLNLEEERFQETDNEQKEEKKGFFEKIIGFFKNILGLIARGGNISSDPKENKIIELSNDYKQYISNNCNFEVLEYNYEELGKVELETISITGEGINELEESAGQCCIGGECTTCCIEESCKNDPSLYPIIFVHGHSAVSWNSLDYSINTFKEFEKKLENNDYVNMGILLPESDINKVKEGSWGKIRKPVMVRVSYYKGVYNENGQTIDTEQDKSITEYAERLSDIVEIVLHHTGKDKVIIVSHSMGGLVSRDYIKNYGGKDKVYKLVTIGTPNHGVWLGDGSNTLCGFTQGGLQECEDMLHDSYFINKVNQGNELMNTLSIIGVCKYPNGNQWAVGGDQVVRKTSAKISSIPDSNNIIVNGTCIPWTEDLFDTFHGNLPRDGKVYNHVINFLQD